MGTPSITTQTNNRPRLRGFALFSVITSLMLTLFLEALDQTIVGAAMPRIVTALHGLDRYSWVVTIYLLASMTVIPVVGKLSDQFGRKWFLLSGTLLFLLGSLLAGTAQNMDQLIISRGVQGLGSGTGIALISTVMADLFPPDERAKWGSLVGVVYGFSSLLGPTFGGWLSEHGPLLGSLVTEESRWSWIFYINIPIALIALVGLLVFLPTHASEQTSVFAGWKSLRRIDAPGVVLCATATICLMLGLNWGGENTYAWTSAQVLAMLITGIILFLLFLLVERKASEPILTLALFRNQIFCVCTLLGLIQMMALMGQLLYLPLFLQGVLGLSPTSSGLVMTPFSLSMVAGSALSGMMISMLKRYQVVALLGAILMSVGALLIALMNPTTSLWQTILFVIVAGIGCGVFFTLPMVAVQNALPAHLLGTSMAAVRYLGQVGASLGIAIVGTVVASGTTGDLMSKLPTTEIGKAALSAALANGFLAVLIFTLIALVATFFLNDKLIWANQENPPSDQGEQMDQQIEKERFYV